MPFVTVHCFKWWDVGTRQNIPDYRKATVKKIAEIPGSEIVDGTAQEVDESEITSDGYWLRSLFDMTDHCPLK